MPDDRYDWVKLTEASRRLGRSPETIRRQIRLGTFEHPHDEVPLAPGSSKTRFIVGFPKGQADAPRSTITPQDATERSGEATIALDAYERGRAAQRVDDAAQRHSDATRIVRQARRIGRLLREIRSLDATAVELARQVVQAEAERDDATRRNAAQARALDDAQIKLARVPGWLRRLLRLD